MTARLEPVPCYRARVRGTDGIIRSWGYFEGDPAQSAFAKQPDFYEIEVLVPAAPAPEGMRGAIVAAVSANVHVNDGQTVIDGPAIAAAIIAIIAKGEGRE